jgi:hypothetical protein
VELTRIFEACQAERLHDWRVIPAGDPGTDLLVGLVDAGDQTGPALSALPHLYRAVYVPDARLGIGWGMTDPHGPGATMLPDWAPEDWSGAERAWAHVLLDGTMVWRVLYTYVNWGAGIDGLLPYPAKRFEKGPDPLRALPGGWDTTRWEVEFVRLLNDLQENDDWRYEDELRGWGLKIFDASPLELTRPGGAIEEGEDG